MRTLILIVLCAGIVKGQTPTPTPTPIMALTLTWDAPLAADSVASVKLYEKTNIGYTVIATVPQPANTKLFPSVTVAPHTYAASFVYTSGLEGPKGGDLIIPMPHSPQNLRATISFQLSMP